MLLTRDRGLLRRRALWLGAYVRGARPDDQFRDVLDRFRPPLAPWTRCPACDGPLSPVAKAAVAWCCLPAPGAPIRRSPAAATAARCTGTAPTASDLSRSSTQQSAPSALAQADKGYQRQNRTVTLTAPLHEHTVGQSRAGPHRGRPATPSSFDNRARIRRYGRLPIRSPWPWAPFRRIDLSLGGGWPGPAGMEPRGPAPGRLPRPQPSSGQAGRVRCLPGSVQPAGIGSAVPVTRTRSSPAARSTSRRLGRPMSWPWRIVTRAGRSTRARARR